MAGAEAVEEVHEGDTALDGGEVRHRGQVHTFLHAGGGQLGHARLAAGHHVLVVAENGEAARAEGARRHVQHAGQELAGNAVERGYHQRQALGGRVAGGEAAALQAALHGAAGARLALHLHQAHALAEDVLHAVGRPGVHVLGHRAGRGDGVNGRNFRERIDGVGRRFVAVHGLFLCHDDSSSQ